MDLNLQNFIVLMAFGLCAIIFNAPLATLNKKMQDKIIGDIPIKLYRFTIYSIGITTIAVAVYYLIKYMK